MFENTEFEIDRFYPSFRLIFIYSKLLLRNLTERDLFVNLLSYQDSTILNRNAYKRSRLLTDTACGPAIMFAICFASQFIELAGLIETVPVTFEL